MQKIIDQLGLLQKMTPENLNSGPIRPDSIHDKTGFCAILNEFAETSLSILQSFSPATEIIPLADHCFDSSFKLGSCLAETNPNDNQFHLLLRQATVFFNARLLETIADAGYSGVDFACLQLFFSQLCSRVEQGFLEKCHSILMTRKHFACVSSFPQQLSYSYVCSIVQKLGHIPMAEVTFEKKLLHKNNNMTELFNSQSITAEDLIPECLFEPQSLAKFVSKSTPEPFFRDLCVNKKTFQQLILVLPQNRVFITFIIETPAKNSLPAAPQNSLLHQDHQNEQLNKIKESFLANMSHELRTPLHEIIGFADLLVEQFDGDLNEAQLEYVQMIQKGGERLLELINYLLKIGGSTAPKASTTPLPINALISEVMHRLEKEISSKKISCPIEIESDLIVYKGDKDRLIIVISEILSYILKHLRQEGRLLIAFSNHNQWNEIKISVADAAFVDFSEEMLLSHATFFLDLMQGHLISETTDNGDRVFKIRLPN